MSEYKLLLKRRWMPSIEEKCDVEVESEVRRVCCFLNPRPTIDWSWSSRDVAKWLDTVEVVPIYERDNKPLRSSNVDNDRYTRSHP